MDYRGNTEEAILSKVQDEYINLQIMSGKLLDFLKVAEIYGFSKIYVEECRKQYEAMQLYLKSLKKRIFLIEKGKHVKGVR